MDNTPSNYVHNIRNAIPIVPYYGDGEGFTRNGRKFGYDHLKTIKEQQRSMENVKETRSAEKQRKFNYDMELVKLESYLLMLA